MMNCFDKYSMSAAAPASCGEASYYTRISLLDALFLASIFVIIARSRALLLSVAVIRGQKK
ncbi:MAG: hypothetical protein IJR68_07645 [Fretibacterium sp.]|nr:hypothetical protein [Fretibacterium sp.]